MLSYRHAFHAGNHADVLKHVVLMQVLGYTTQKDKPYWYIDTHAGAGKYAMDSGYAAQNAEFANGIGLLWEQQNMPGVVREYVDLVRQENKSGKLLLYPGSPAIAQHFLRESDRMRLFELHPNDFKLLCQTFTLSGKQVAVAQENGFEGLKAMLPPPPRRAVVLIDPPYEEKQDYQRVVIAMQDSLQRFATGTFIVWYPLLQRTEPGQMIDKLKRLPLKSWLHATLTVQAPSPDGFGMYGSGLFVVNPPWTLPQQLAELLPYLAQALKLDDGATFNLESLIP